MPGAGRLTFSAGQILTASQVQDYLQDQAVMNFSGTAARATGIPTPSAGMVTHIGGGTVQVYNGTAWTNVDTAGGLVKITDATFSAQSSVSVNNCFSATYDSYRIIVDLSNGTSDCDINMRLRVSGSDASGANYFTAGNLCSSAGVTGAFFRDAGTSGLMAGIDSGFPTLNAISSDFINPFTARATRIHVDSSYTTGASVWQGVSCSLLHNLATSYDGFTLFASAGNISGTLRVYGYRN